MSGQPMDVLSLMARHGFVCGDPNSAISQTRDAVAALIEAGSKLDSAMDMQEKRETGEFHLSSVAALQQWMAARRAWTAALARLSGAPQ